MEESELSNTSVEVLSLAPRGKYRWLYSINQGDPHIGAYDSVYKLLFSVLPQRMQQMEALLHSFQTFVVIVPSEEVIPLTFDLEAAEAEMLDGIKKTSVQKALSALRALQRNAQPAHRVDITRTRAFEKLLGTRKSKT